MTIRWHFSSSVVNVSGWLISPMNPSSSEECTEGTDHRLPVSIPVVLRPKHHVVHAWAIAFEKDITSAQRDEYSISIQRQDAMAFHCKDRVLVAPVCCEVKE